VIVTVVMGVADMLVPAGEISGRESHDFFSSTQIAPIYLHKENYQGGLDLQMIQSVSKCHSLMIRIVLLGPWWQVSGVEGFTFMHVTESEAKRYLLLHELTTARTKQ
jgi:hypothetical protein